MTAANTWTTDSFGSSLKDTPGNLVYWGVHLWQGL